MGQSGALEWQASSSCVVSAGHVDQGTRNALRVERLATVHVLWMVVDRLSNGAALNIV